MAERRGSARLLAELFVIVVGVLTALVAESWWSEREERRYERELREDIVAEFDQNLRILESDMAINDTAFVRTRSLVGMDDAELLALPHQALTDRFGYGVHWAGFDPAMGNVQALVQSGNLGALADRDLRLLLARWSGLLTEKDRFGLQAVDFQYGSVTPFIARAGADRVWTEQERRELQALLVEFTQLQTYVMQNMGRLRDAALEIQRHMLGG